MPLPMSFSLIVSTAQEDGEGFFLFPSYEMLNGKYQTDIQYRTDIQKKKKKKKLVVDIRIWVELLKDIRTCTWCYTSTFPK